MTTPVQDDATLRELHRTLGRLSTRISVVAANMANVDTPGYRAQRAEFTKLLDSKLQIRAATTDSGHIGVGAPPVRHAGMLVDAPVLRERMDGNTVDLDQEMTMQARLQGRYSAAAQMIKKRFALLRYALTDGRS